MSKTMVKKILATCLQIAPKSLRYRLLRRMIKIPDLPDNLSFEIARTREDLDAAFSLLYDAYLRENITAPVPSKRRVTLFHCLPSTTTLVAKKHKTIIATVSIIRDGLFGVPVQDIVDVSRFRVPGKLMAEVSSLAMRTDLQGLSTGVMFYLTKYLIKYSREYFGIDRFMIAVHPKRIPLYEGLFLFVPLRQKINSYGFANNAPAMNATNDLETAEERFKHVYGGTPLHRNLYQFLFQSFTTREKACMKFPERQYVSISDPVMTPELMDYFFNRVTRLFDTLTHRQLRQLASVYAHPRFLEVLPCQGRGAPLADHLKDHPGYDMKCYGLVYPENTPLPVFITVVHIRAMGMQVYTHALLPQKTRTRFFIVIGHHRLATVTGWVLRSQGPLHDIRFAQVDAQWEKFILYQHCRNILIPPQKELLLKAVS